MSVEWIDLLIRFIVFCLVIVFIVVGLQWIGRKTGLDAELIKIILWVVGALAIIVFLLQFVRPLLVAA